MIIDQCGAMGSAARKLAPPSAPRIVAGPEAWPLDSPAQLLHWYPGSDAQDELCRASVPLPKRQASNTADGDMGGSRPRLLACHDLAGGYGMDRYPQGGTSADSYCLRSWHCLDAFCYFSHHLVTIPPPGWVNAAHTHGVPVLGTLITEWEAGAAHCRTLFGSAEATEAAAAQLAAIAQHRGFEGWLINIENELDVRHISHVLHFLRALTVLMRQVAPGWSQVVWYDAVTTEGRLEWQNKLTALNRPFFDACDAIWINYTWKEATPALVRQEAGERRGDVYMGVDCFGRGTFGGGGFACGVALRACLEQELSAALFAPGWPYEGDCGRDAPACWRQRDALFWHGIESAWQAGCSPSHLSIGSLSSNLPAGKVQQLPLYTDFSLGSGWAMHLGGRLLSPRPWYNLSLQGLQPLLRVQVDEEGSCSSGSDDCGMVWADISQEQAFSRGSSLRLSGSLWRGQLASVQLYRSAVPLPPAGIWVRLTASPAEGAEVRLALGLALAGSSAGAGSTSIELLTLLGTDGSVQLPSVSSGGGAAALVVTASSKHAIQQQHHHHHQGAATVGSGDEDIAAVAAATAAESPPQWATRSYHIVPKTLAAATAAAELGEKSSWLLTGVDVLVLGAGSADGNPAPFQAYLGELCIEEVAPDGRPWKPPGSVQQLSCSSVKVAPPHDSNGSAASVLTARLAWKPPVDGSAARCHVWYSFSGCGEELAAPHWLGTACTDAYWLTDVAVPRGATAAMFSVQAEGCNGQVQEMPAAACIQVSLEQKERELETALVWRRAA